MLGIGSKTEGELKLRVSLGNYEPISHMSVKGGIRVLGEPILQLMDNAFGGPFLFVVRRSTLAGYNAYCDTYLGYYNGKVGTIIVSKSRSDTIQGCDDEIQYYYVRGSEYFGVGRIRTWSSMSNDLVGRDLWYRWCREFGLYPAEDIEEQLLAAEVREEN